MINKKGGYILPIAIVVLVVVSLGLLLFAWLGSSNNSGNENSAVTSDNVSNQSSNSANDDATLDNDSAAVDAQVKALDSDNSDIDSSMNDSSTI